MYSSKAEVNTIMCSQIALDVERKANGEKHALVDLSTEKWCQFGGYEV